ncbi:hypothetical protein GCM10023085_10010 [Actinomadura viridis]|uniref:LapA family protein n=1 Tax=Actinomadura viridis TaxID=58110 RepID=A0A931GLX5_9ACTN|nr:hypothetical protein [Actinomadura viridis]MBG6092012.1 hypothetical protein [Actinomadura viridis]
MVFLGLLVAAVAVTAAAGIVLDNEGAAALTAFGQNVPGVGDQGQVFLAGAVVAAVFMFGLQITFKGVRRSRRARRDLRELREEREESLSTLQLEKRRLQQEVARLRRGEGAGSPDRTSPARNPQARNPQAPAPAPAPAPGAQTSAPGTPVAGSAVPPKPGPTRKEPLAGAAARTTFFDRAD